MALFSIDDFSQVLDDQRIVLSIQFLYREIKGPVRKMTVEKTCFINFCCRQYLVPKVQVTFSAARVWTPFRVINSLKNLSD